MKKSTTSAYNAHRAAVIGGYWCKMLQKIIKKGDNKKFYLTNSKFFSIYIKNIS